ncbi:glycosyltransferase family 1 protein [Rhizoctonia solani]|nr:glycosyltransferase family 1 protein [Rhizoctonia solani]
MVIDDRKDRSPKRSQRQSTTTSTTYRSSSLESVLYSSEGLIQTTPHQGSLPAYSPRTQSGESTLELGSSRFETDASESKGGSMRNLKLDAKAAFQDDGRLQVSFGHRFSKSLPPSYAEPVHEVGIDEDGFRDAPPMNVNIMIVGSRGDVQPFLALGQKLQRYGHTVRLSTHETFRKLVKDAGLRFFSIGGDPHELMSYMVRNPGLIPGFESMIKGDIGKKQAMVAEILDKCYLSCYETDKGSPEENGFVADAIISNPPTFAHIHCAEAFGIPLLLSFTMPWCATASFPHPLVNIKQDGSHEPKAVNYYSYTLVDMLTWQGLGNVINKFRAKRLGLDYLTTASAVTMIERCGIPWTYCLSPALVPKPKDWLSHIDVTGFYFLDLAKDYDPPADLVEFICSGEPPIYVGFGSIVLNNPQEMTRAVLDGIAQAGVRAIVSPGWGGLDEAMIKTAGPHVFALGNAPHDWLFQYVSAVCHHGGAGTTAIGLKCGKPTIIVPFFGDQPWWAAQLAQRGAGPAPLDSRSLTAEAFAAAIEMALSPNTEDGTKNGTDSFHRHLPLLNMRCDLDPKRVAVWYSPTHKLRLSTFSAQVLVERGEIDVNKLKLHRSREYNPHALPTDPVTGTALPLLRVINDFTHGFAKIASSRPDKGVLQMMTSPIGGLQTTLQGMTDGLTNVPRLYGSEIREPKKVTGFGSGMVEGGKGFAYGFYDGITDLVREPVKGYKEKGVMGAVTGFGTGALNLHMKPAAGMLQLFSKPVEGGVKKLRGISHKDISQERIAVRRAEGVLAVKQASQMDQDAVVQAFAEYKARQLRKKKGKGKAS